ncbi:MAG: hypothetical protein K6F68_00995 [Clostridiales bacterium]|nr:hypothetical protein [Clostridiales bacterium]
MKRRILSFVVAVLLAMTALPALALRGAIHVRYATPSGYNEHDYQKLVAFLETEDETGVKNGTKLNPDYDPDDPATWTGVEWMEERSEYRVNRITFSGCDLVGTLDVSGMTDLLRLTCSDNRLTGLVLTDCDGLWYIECFLNDIAELDVSDDPGLMILLCSGLQLTELDVTHNPLLVSLNCGYNQLTELDVTHNPELTTLVCHYNQLTSLDLSNNTALTWVSCEGNEITEIDLSNCEGMTAFDLITAEGGGTVACSMEIDFSTSENHLVAVATPENGGVFMGWFAEDGTLISEELEIRADEYAEQYPRVIAKFSMRGDADGNGKVEATDALLALRVAMGIIDAPDNIAVYDVDGNGKIEAADALLILRYAMGIIDHF